MSACRRAANPRVSAALGEWRQPRLKHHLRAVFRGSDRFAPKQCEAPARGKGLFLVRYVALSSGRRRAIRDPFPILLHFRLCEHSRYPGFGPTGSGSAKPEIEPCPAWGVIAHGDAGAVRSNDFHDDRQAKSGSLTSRALAAPEPIEDARPVSQGYARPTVRDAQCTLAADLDDHFGPGSRMRQRVFDQVAQRICDGVGIPGNSYWVLGAGQRDRAAAGQRQMCHRADHLLRDLKQIDRGGDIERDRIKTSYTEKLLDKPVHPPDLLPQC